MSENISRQQNLGGNSAVLVSLLTDLLVPSCNQALHVLQGKHAMKVERGCQIHSEKRLHWSDLWFLTDNRISSSVQRLPGSWQHRHLAYLGAVAFFSMTATEHLKMPVPGALCTEWQLS